MPSFSKYLSSLLLSGTLIVAPAFAQDSGNFIEDLKALAASGDVVLNFGEVDDRGNGSVEASDITAVAEIEGEDIAATALKMSVEGYQKTATGVSFDDFQLNTLTAALPDDVAVLIENISIKDLIVSEDENADLKSLLQPYTSYLVENIVLNIGGNTVATFASGQGKSSHDEASGTYSETAEWTGIVFDIENSPEGQFRTEAIAMGYLQVHASVVGNYTIRPAEGIIKVENFTTNVDDVASLSYSLTLGGLTEDVIRSLSSASANVTELSQEEQEAQMKQMMAALLQLSVIDVTLEIKDDSITQKLLNRQAKEMGMTGEQLAGAAPAFVSAGMQQFNMPEFTAQVSQAVGTFLQDQGSLIVSVKPDSAVPVMQFGMTMGLNPASAIDLYNVKVEAR
jgi:hypothetical protein